MSALLNAVGDLLIGSGTFVHIVSAFVHFFGA
jgi:hypothetical protein